MQLPPQDESTTYRSLHVQTLPGMVCTNTSNWTDPVLPGVVAGLHGGCDVHSAVVLLVTHGDGMRRREKPEFLPSGHSHVSRCWPNAAVQRPWARSCRATTSKASRTADLSASGCRRQRLDTLASALRSPARGARAKAAVLTVRPTATRTAERTH